MHIPDGFLAPAVYATLDAVSLGIVAVAAKRAQRQSEESRLPLLGAMGAFVFAAQMINFPVGPGTSGHLVGAALLAGTIGPAAAIIVMTAILGIQALVFQDGGVLALGANLFNMGIAGVLAGWLPFRLARGRMRTVAAFAGGMLSVLVAACLTLAQLLLSGIPLPGAVLQVSLGLFVVNALLEGAITATVYGALTRMGKVTEPGPLTTRPLQTGLLAASILLAAVGVLWASAAPDGLEALAAQLGIEGRAHALWSTSLADYEWRGLHSEWLRKASAGLTGLGLVWGVCFLFGRAVSRRAA